MTDRLISTPADVIGLMIDSMDRDIRARAEWPAPGSDDERLVQFDGEEAREVGIAREQCPHPPGSRARGLWIEGWDFVDRSARRQPPHERDGRDPERDPRHRNSWETTDGTICDPTRGGTSQL